MKKLPVLVFMMLVVSCLFFFTNQGYAETVAGGSISGKVKDSATQAGIAGIKVNLYDNEHFYAVISSATTDATGSYTMADLVSGSYTVKFDPGTTGYATQWHNNKPAGSVADAITVTAGSTTTLADALLTVSATITGKVKDNVSRAGIANISVSVYDSQSGAIVADVATDAAGSYTVTGLAGGEYKLQFIDGNQNYALQWYNNKLGSSVADTVVVTAGNTTTLADTLLIEGGKVSGKVRDSKTLAGVAGCGVSVYDSVSGSSGYAVSDANGNYTVTGLATGNHTVMFSAPEDYLYYNNADPVAVTAGSTTTLNDVFLVMGGRVSGHVKDGATQAGIAGIRVYVYDSQNKVVTSVLTGYSGDYSTSVLASGSYKVRFDRNQTNYVSQWNDNKADIGATDPVVLTAPATTVVNASLAVGGSISGTVTDSSGAPLAGIPINIQDSNDIFISSAVTDVSGNYLAKGLPSGSHKVRFVGNSKGFVNKYYGDTIYPANAQTVLVQAPDQTSGVNASLVRGGSISGTVTAAGGVPLSGVFVQAYDVNSVNVSSATTSYDGSYTLAGIPAGAVKVAFYSGSRYAGQWYGGAGSFAAAAEVAVSAGAAVSGINAQLGSGPSIYFGGDSRDFGNVSLNAKEASRTLFVYNYGTDNLALEPLSLGGANAAEFTMLNDDCSGKSLLPGASCTFRISFSPSSVGLKAADITVHSNDPDTPALAIHVKVNCTANIQTYPLTLSFAGTGGGSVSDDVSCTSGTSCPLVAFGMNSPVNLIPLADSISTFAGWSGACTNTSGNCTFTMDSAKTVTATFTAAPKVKVGTKGFSTFQSAYNDTATTTGSVIKLLEGTQTENVTIARNISVFLQGGYLATYSGVGTETSIKGKLLLRSGTVRVKGVNIR